MISELINVLKDRSCSYN